jgi:hypothetical protein
MLGKMVESHCNAVLQQLQRDPFTEKKQKEEKKPGKSYEAKMIGKMIVSNLSIAQRIWC